MARRRKAEERLSLIIAEQQRQLDRLRYQDMAKAGKGSIFEPSKDWKPKPATPPPTFSECVVGYRVWTIDAFGRLRPQSVNQRSWTPGVNVAVCDAEHTSLGGHLSVYHAYYGSFPSERPRQREPHAAPSKDCSCGLYARFCLDHLPKVDNGEFEKMMVPTVIGSIAAWGEIQVHRDGIRAEKACVTALATTDQMVPELRSLIASVADTYRVPSIPFAMLESEALMHGTLLPEEVVPKPTRNSEFDDLTALYSRMLGSSVYGSGTTWKYR